MAKKTMSLLKLQNWANDMLENPDIDLEARKKICSLLEDELHSAGHYKGFVYLHDKFPKLPGSRYVTEDEYRRHYIYSTKLTGNG